MILTLPLDLLGGGTARAAITRLVHLVDGTSVPSVIEVGLWIDKTKQVAVTMRLEVHDGVAQCRRVTLESADNGREARSSDLAGIRLEQLAEDIVAAFGLLGHLEEGGATRWAPVSTVAETQAVQQAVHANRTARRLLNPAFLQEVAAVYVAHRSEKPTTAVMAWGRERLGRPVAHRTAAHWVKKAELDGFLPPTTPGRRRGT